MGCGSSTDTHAASPPRAHLPNPLLAIRAWQTGVKDAPPPTQPPALFDTFVPCPLVAPNPIVCECTDGVCSGRGDGGDGAESRARPRLGSGDCGPSPQSLLDLVEEPAPPLRCSAQSTPATSAAPHFQASAATAPASRSWALASFATTATTAEAHVDSQARRALSRHPGAAADTEHLPHLPKPVPRAAPDAEGSLSTSATFARSTHSTAASGYAASQTRGVRPAPLVGPAISFGPSDTVERSTPTAGQPDHQTDSSGATLHGSEKRLSLVCATGAQDLMALRSAESAAPIGVSEAVGLSLSGSQLAGAPSLRFESLRDGPLAHSNLSESRAVHDGEGDRGVSDKTSVSAHLDLDQDTEWVPIKHRAATRVRAFRVDPASTGSGPCVGVTASSGGFLVFCSPLQAAPHSPPPC